MERKNVSQNCKASWKYCLYCPRLYFETDKDFERHLRDKHRSNDNVCQYGFNGRCVYLFYDKSGDPYEKHVYDYHIHGKQYSTDWSIYTASQILPAVLNDPSRGKEPTFFTKTWGDAFLEKNLIPNSPYLPDVTLTHFESYLKRHNKRHRRHCRLISEKVDSNYSKAKLSSTIEENYEVPSIFFKQILSLNDIATFRVVFPTLIDPKNGKLITRDLQDELSNYLDVVEMQISKQVSQKSETFFNAMMSNETVMEQMSSASKVVKSLREKMKTTKTQLATRSLKIIQLNRNKSNSYQVYEKLKLMATVHQTQPMIQLLLSTSDYVAAVDLISHTQSILSSQLAGIHAFRHLSSQLTEMERLIDKMLSAEFQRFCVLDLNRPLADETILPENDKLIPIVSGLLRQKQFDFIDTYKMEATTTIQTTVKQAMIEIVSQREESAEVCLRGTGDTSSFLGSSESVALMERVTPLLILLLRRILSVHDIILKVSQMDSIGFVENDDYLSLEDHEKIEKKLKKVLETLGDYCSERCANVISAKNDKEHLLLNGEQVVHLTKLIEGFTSKCEEICGKHDGMLNLALKSHAMRYIQHFHNEKRNKVTLLLENERWKQAEVPYEFQSMIDCIVKSNQIPSLSRDLKSDKPAAMFLLVKEEPYAVVGTVLLLVRTICEYCHCANELISMSQYVGHCVSELLRTFNSRCCQLVLGAGALQSAGLKTITTTNLALVSRALQLILWIIPFVKTHFETLNPTSSNITAFALIEKDVSSHIQEIKTKIEMIAGNLVSGQLTSWDARPPVPSQAFRNISKHLLKLHEALVNILPSTQIQGIYSVLHILFKEKLREQLMRMNIVANGGPQHGVVTSELTFYIQTLKTLNVINKENHEDALITEVWKK